MGSGMKGTKHDTVKAPSRHVSFFHQPSMVTASHVTKRYDFTHPWMKDLNGPFMDLENSKALPHVMGPSVASTDMLVDNVAGILGGTESTKNQCMLDGKVIGEECICNTTT
ncbi:hypothetical protein RIF29_38190 [Crotalaria pallida]|uniref:Uncharacterized protein n=1 Tax=Crotalaria pallida TaxID=3830 RepID=A0AAN9DZH6_CROPI